MENIGIYFYVDFVRDIKPTMVLHEVFLAFGIGRVGP